MNGVVWCWFGFDADNPCLHEIDELPTHFSHCPGTRSLRQIPPNQIRSKDFFPNLVRRESDGAWIFPGALNNWSALRGLEVCGGGWIAFGFQIVIALCFSLDLRVLVE